MSERKTSSAEIGRLVTAFGKQISEALADDYTEQDARSDFINPLFEALGWDVRNTSGLPRDQREVVQERSLRVQDEAGAKKPDYLFRRGRERQFFVEAKKPSVDIFNNTEAAFQAKRYGFAGRTRIAVLTNFRQLVVYDTRRKPEHGEATHVARVSKLEYTEFIARFDELFDRLSREATYSALFDSHFPEAGNAEGAEPFDEYFLEQVETWRKWIVADLFRQHKTLSGEELTLLAQRYINRLVFLRMCEDLEFEKYETLKGLEKGESAAEWVRLLAKADSKYNSGLFNTRGEAIEKFAVSNEVLAQIASELYLPKSPFDFSVIPPEVLGEVYDRFLGSRVEVAGSRLRVSEKPETVAGGGVVPTPLYVVRRIVEHSLEPLLEGGSLVDASRVRVADIACGSGVFLLGALEYLMEWHRRAYVTLGAANFAGDKLYDAGDGDFRLTLAEKRRIVGANVFGVDIDSEAVEVAKFSLLLKLLEDETPASIADYMSKTGERALPDLAENIKCGNSLVSPGEYLRYDPTPSEVVVRKLNAFDWRSEFKEVSRAGGFDAIIGNPPYVRIQNMVQYAPEEVDLYQSQVSPYEYIRDANFDKYALFIERAIGLLRKAGILGFIVSHKFFRSQAGLGIRKLMHDRAQLLRIVYFGDLQVFPGRTTYPCILIARRGS